jgi:hypothetical protein
MHTFRFWTTLAAHMVTPLAPLRDISEPFAYRRVDRLPAQLLSYGIAAAVVAMVAQTAIHLVNALLVSPPLRQLNADAEGNVFTWASSTATFVCAIATLGLYVLLVERVGRLLLLTAILTFFSIDEVAQFHERLNRLGQSWTVFAAPLLVLAGALIWDLSRGLDPRASRTILVGLVSLAGAVCAEAVQRFWLLDYGEDSWAYALDTGLEEAAELGGWMLIGAGLLSALARSVHDSSIQSPTDPVRR